MPSFKSTLWAALTFVVALATVCALVLPEEDGVRGTVVRLTRGGLQRQCYTGASCHDFEENEPRLEAPGETRVTAVSIARVDGSTHLAVLPAIRTVAPPGDSLVSFPAFLPTTPSAPCGYAPPERAPPAI